MTISTHSKHKYLDPNLLDAASSAVSVIRHLQDIVADSLTIARIGDATVNALMLDIAEELMKVEKTARETHTHIVKALT